MRVRHVEIVKTVVEESVVDVGIYSYIHACMQSCIRRLLFLEAVCVWCGMTAQRYVTKVLEVLVPYLLMGLIGELLQ